MKANEKKYWLDDSKNLDRLYYGLWVVGLLLVASELFYHGHPHFAWESWIGFNAILGFVAFFLIVLTGRPLRKLLARDEDYYDR